MTVVFWCVLLMPVAADPNDGLAKQMLPIYQREAAAYTIAVETAPKKPLELKKEPVLEWSNPGRDGLAVQGVVFLWLRDGRPAVVCSMFSEPRNEWKGRTLLHEFHALDTEKLIVTRPKEELNDWQPEVGLARKELPDAPAPADTPAARLLQMKKLAQEFSGHGVDLEKKRVDMRLLPTPLYRYPAAKAEPVPKAPGEAPNKTGVIDGALFTLVDTTGTDPEILLVIEAREENGKARWEYACGRFSDKSLYVQRKGKEVWSLPRGETNTWLHDPQHLFRVYPDKIVTLEGKLIARLKATEKVWWGEFFPANEK